MGHLEETRNLLGDLIAFPTVSSDSNLDMIHFLANRLEDAGARAEIQHDTSGQKANLFATMGPDTDGGIVLSGQSDVVPLSLTLTNQSGDGASDVRVMGLRIRVESEDGSGIVPSRCARWLWASIDIAYMPVMNDERLVEQTGVTVNALDE